MLNQTSEDYKNHKSQEMIELLILMTLQKTDQTIKSLYLQSHVLTHEKRAPKETHDSHAVSPLCPEKLCFYGHNEEKAAFVVDNVLQVDPCDRGHAHPREGLLRWGDCHHQRSNWNPRQKEKTGIWTDLHTLLSCSQR